MKLTIRQLRKIIKEEVTKGVVKEFRQAPREEGGVPSWMISIFNELKGHAEEMMKVKAQREAALEILKSMENLTEAMRKFDEEQGESLYQKVYALLDQLDVLLAQDEKDDIAAEEEEYDEEEDDDFMQENRKIKHLVRRR